MTHLTTAFDLARTLKPPVGSPLHTILLAIVTGELHDGPFNIDIKQEFELTTPRTGASSMTHTEAADLILRASGSGMRYYTTQATRDAILAAVATVMDAARAEERASVVAWLEEQARAYDYSEKVFAYRNLMLFAAAIRDDMHGKDARS